MTNTTPTPQKSVQESEIDHLLAEEFHCDPDFLARFAAACGLEFENIEVINVIPEFVLEGDLNGYGDLLVEANMDGKRLALLIEDKITAGPAVRQAERYAKYAQLLLSRDWDCVVTVLVAPGSYRSERDGYQANIDLETVTKMLRSPDCRRLAWRRDIIERAIRKKASTGVQNVDDATHQLHSTYLKWAAEICAVGNIPYRFPRPRKSYDHKNSWIEGIRHPDFPDNVQLRHRLWTSTRERRGMVDLIVSPAPESERSRLKRAAPDWVIVKAYGSRRQGTKLSIQVPEMRQSTGFCEIAAAEAFGAIERLTAFFLELEWE